MAAHGSREKINVGLDFLRDFGSPIRVAVYIQDFRLCRQESMNLRNSQLSPQVITQPIIFNLKSVLRRAFA
jgi:hypothetical protein